MADDALGTVLVVDGDPQVRLLFRTALEAVKYHVVTAESGQHAVNLLAHYDVDVILLDLAMAKREGVDDGSHLMRRLEGARPGCQIIPMVERDGGDSVLQETPVLEKPCRLDTLLELVSEQVRMSRAQ